MNYLTIAWALGSIFVFFVGAWSVKSMEPSADTGTIAFVAAVTWLPLWWFVYFVLRACGVPA